MTPATRLVCQRVLEWRRLVTRTVANEPWLVLALIAQESHGDPWAIRPELGFMKRYATGIAALVKRTVSTRDDYWTRYPEFFSASYGLMQILLVRAVELGFTFRYPTELLDPTTNLEFGGRALTACFDAVPASTTEPIRAALLRWNGGGDPTYPDKVLRWRVDLMTCAQEEEGGQT